MDAPTAFDLAIAVQQNTEKNSEISYFTTSSAIKPPTGVGVVEFWLTLTWFLFPGVISTFTNVNDRVSMATTATRRDIFVFIVSIIWS